MLVYDSGRSLHGTPGEREPNSALMFLATGAELILKQLLVDKDWKLVCKRTTVSEEQYQSGDFESINAEETITALRKHQIFNVPDSLKDALKMLRAMRNKFMHFAIVPTKEALVSVAVVVIDGIILFQQEFHDGYLDDELRELVLEIDEYRACRENQIQPALKEACKQQTILRCNYCLNVAAVLKSEGEWSCLFCQADLTMRNGCRSER